MPHSTRVEHHQPSEFDLSSPFVARNDPRMRLKVAEHFFLRSNFLSFPHPRTRLSVHTTYLWMDLPRLISQALSRLLTSPAQRMLDTLVLVHHLFGGLHQTLVQLTLLLVLLFFIAPSEPMQ
jgi:hypothetical protein